MQSLLIAVIAASFGIFIGYMGRALQVRIRKPLPWYERPTTLCKLCKKPLKLHGYQGYRWGASVRSWIHGVPNYCCSNSTDVFTAMPRDKQLLLEIGEE